MLEKSSSKCYASLHKSEVKYPHASSAPLSMRKAFRAFSADCCARKQATLYLLPERLYFASSRSRSAWRNHLFASLTLLSLIEGPPTS